MKKVMLKSAAILLASVELLTMAACGNNATDEITETEASPETAEATEAQPALLNFFGADSQYKLIRGDEASDAQIQSFLRLKNAIVEKTGFKPELTTDWAKSEADYGQYEILFGSTNRPETAEALAKINGAGYVICVINEKLVFAATSDKALDSAVSAFTEAVLEGGTTALPDYYLEIGEETAAITSVTINGIPLKEFTIVASSKATYELPLYTLTDFFEEYCAVALKTASSTENITGHKIIVGGTKADGSAYGRFETEIYFKDGDLHIGCQNTTMAQKSIYTFIAQYLSKAGKAEITLPDDGSPLFNSSQPDDWSDADPGTFITIQDRICRSAYMAQAILEYDTSLGKPYSYRGSDYKSTFTEARKSNVRLTNCVILSNWVMKQAGFYTSGIYNIKYDGTTGYKFGGGSAEFFTENFDIIDMRDRNVSISTLTKSGEVQAGDVIIYQNHTMIVLPLGNCCDGGRGNTEEKKVDSNFVKWVGPTLYPSMIVGFIFRPKDAN